MATPCSHLDGVAITETDKDYCEDCRAVDDTWVHLRLCLSCGHVGCCDSSKNKHATRHYRGSTHPLVRSIEPGEGWIWCYVERVMAGELAV